VHRRPEFDGPYIVKPRFGGSSIGIEVVSDYVTAHARLSVNPHLKRGAVLEPYRPELFDLQLAVRMWPDAELSAIERPLRSRAGSENPRLCRQVTGRAGGMTSAPRELPAHIAPHLEEQIRAAALVLAGPDRRAGSCPRRLPVRRRRRLRQRE